MSKMTLGIYLQKVLDKKGMKVSHLADKAELSHVYIGNLVKDLDPKTGKSPNPTLDSVIAIAKALNIPSTNLMLAHQGVDPDDINTPEKEAKRLLTQALNRVLDEDL